MPKLDEEPSIEEQSKQIDRLPSEKAPGKDTISAKVTKSGKSSLLVPLHKLLIQCWKDGSVSQDMQDTSIVTLYKNKVDRFDCKLPRHLTSK